MYKNYCEDKNKLENLKNNFQNNEKQRDFLSFQIEEIKNAEISDVNEFETLTAKADILNNAAELKEAAYNSYSILYGEETNVIDGLMNVESNLKKVSQYDKSLEEIQNSISDVTSNLRELARSLRNYEENCEVNEEQINEVQARLEVLSKIKRKYGNSLQEVLDNYKKFQDEYSILENSDEYITELEQSIQKKEADLKGIAEKISSNRKILAEKIAAEVTQELHSLEMPYAKFDVKIENKELSANGIDNIEFMIITNPSEPFKPLSKIASGGEISRVMLAIKSILAEADKISCVIFDEIDTGISGRTSQAIANKLQKLAATHQILLITHQPIIAAVANIHFHVIKEQSENDFSTKVKKLDKEERAIVLSKMLSGDNSGNSLSLAYELLNR
jgi:DNA repair protein RecN (Recombination protein N)